jgi:hypothetical protein
MVYPELQVKDDYEAAIFFFLTYSGFKQKCELGIGSWCSAAFLREGNKMKPERWVRRGTWYAVAFVLPMLMIMVSPALSATAWYNWYNAANNTTYYAYNGNWRLAYTSGIGQWWDFTGNGMGLGTWNKLGGTGVSPAFLGDAAIGAYYNLNNGWCYGYDTRSDAGYWWNGSAWRFAYNYGVGQWYDWSQWSDLNNKCYHPIGSPKFSSAFIGDGVLRDLGNGWSFEYVSSTDTAYWRPGIFWRLGYQYTPGQWWDCSQLGGEDHWHTLGSTGVSSVFLGNADIGAFYPLHNGWVYGYSRQNDTEYWHNGASFRYGYYYAGLQWMDYTQQGWGLLGVHTPRDSQFIGDGNRYQFGAGDWFHGNSQQYYWNSGGQDVYRYTFSTGAWESAYLPGQWDFVVHGTWGGFNGQNPDVRYLYNGLFVERVLQNDDTTLLYAPSGKQRLRYTVTNPANGWTAAVAQWTIYNPGVDKKWSGGPLNIFWGSTVAQDQNANWIVDYSQSYKEFTTEDVVCFAEDMWRQPIGFANMVTWMMYVRDYFGEQISTELVAGHGGHDWWCMGEPMSANNYTDYESNWLLWGALMTPGTGQLITFACQVADDAQGKAMLDTISGWTGMNIYANSGPTYSTILPFSNAYPIGDPEVWNGNIRRIVWVDNNSNPVWTPARNFEYTTPGAPAYRWLLRDNFSY